MKKLVHYASHLAGQLAAAWRKRSTYASRREALRALGLRLVAIRSLRRLTRPGVTTLRLRNVDAPFYVRRATSDFWVLEEVYEYGEYASVTQLNLPPDARILDLGANIGLACRYFASLFPACRIVAVEPDRDNGEMVAHNCRELIDAGRLEVVSAFASATSGEAAIDRSFDAYGFTMVSAEGRPAEERIACVPVERLLDRFGPGEVDLLKCDIEGAESALFAACAAWIGRVRNVVIETHVPYSLAALYADLNSAGWPFDIVASDEKGDRSVALLRRRAK